MQSFTAEVAVPVRESFRVRQIAGMFDVPAAETLRRRFTVELPDAGDAWQIGLIVGPSGSGKSTIARQAFGSAVYEPTDWPRELAVIDALGPAPIKQLVGLLTAVGFGSPPSWLKPYEVLSGGERFRCDLARALIQGSGFRAQGSENSPEHITVFDEFTSVVDRNVARACAAAVSKAVRAGHVHTRFVAVTCHYDVEAWLEPDWTLDMATGRTERRRLRRPRLELQLRRCGAGAWPLFARHHYLTGGLNWGARCYTALWQGVPTALCAVLPMFGRRGAWRISRLVTLPDFQGLGIGTRLAEAVGDLYLAEGAEFRVTAAHPALLAHCLRSPRWRLRRTTKQGRRRMHHEREIYCGSAGRATATFEYLGDADLLPVRERGRRPDEGRAA